MKAYFTASIVGKKDYLANYERIIQELTTRECDVIADHILKSTPQEVVMESPEERLAFHKKLETWIRESDVVIAETSFPSISVGYEISMAIFYNKPVLILHAVGTKPPTLLMCHHNEKVIYETYSDHSLTGIIREFVNYAKAKKESRFTFFITPEIAIYLEEISRKKKMPKSVYLRKLIEKDMK